MTEVVIYHVYNSASPEPLPTQISSEVESGVSRILLKTAMVFAVLGFSVLIFSFAPSILNRFASFSLSQTEVANLTRTAATAKDTRYTPPVDPRLPVANQLTISAIGVDTTIQEATYDNYEAALKKGVWRVSDFGAPGEEGVPVILAAHRYGYLAWTNLYRRQNSFFNLPKLKVGDRLEIVYQQRKYTYEVYSEGKGSEIMDYTADLILYTCESLTGEERVFRYAKLVKV
jgi:sortase (surface protein transpeptidase)